MKEDMGLSGEAANAVFLNFRARAANQGLLRKQLVVLLPVALINDLKRRALEQSVSSGKRVTQQLLVEEALNKYLNGYRPRTESPASRGNLT